MDAITNNNYYSKQFIFEIVGHLDTQLLEFFNHNKDVYDFPYQEYRDVVGDALAEHYEGTLIREDSLVLHKKNQKARTKKRTRWYQSYADTLDEYLSNPDSVPADLKKLSEEELYEYVMNERASLEAWRTDTKSFLIQFPGLYLIKANSIYASFKSDIAYQAWSYIDGTLHGNISAFMRSYPASLLDSPLFSPTSFTMIMDEKGNGNLTNTVYDENGDFLLEISTPDTFNPAKVLDNTDLKIINVLMSNITNDFYANKTVIMDLGKLTKAVVQTYKPGEVNKESIAEHCTKLVKYDHTIKRGRAKISFNFFDNIVIEKDTKDPYVIATFGEVLATEIIQKKLISVTERDYSKLQNRLSTIIFYALQRERISLNGQEPMIGQYSYTFFQKIVRFHYKQKYKNIKLIAESLQEFIDNNVCIRSFSLERDLFQIEFLPLTEEELADIDFGRKYVSIEESSL